MIELMIIPTNIGNEPLTHKMIVPVKTVQLKMNSKTVGHAKPPMYLEAMARSSAGVMSESLTQNIPLA